MKIYHTSPIEIKKINEFGIAGDCLFFSDNIYVMTAANDYFTYTIDIDDTQILPAHHLHDDEIIAEIAEEFGVDSDTAESLLDDSGNPWDYSCDAEKAWWLQGKQGECAKKMGYQACESTDEQGAVYIVPMLCREHDLRLLRPGIDLSY